MRLRKLKNSDIIMKGAKNYISDPCKIKGKWNLEFNNNNPIYIEIGMGKGKFIRENAINNPDINFIGIDKFDTIIAKSLNNINDYISNLRIIRYDAKNLEDVFLNEIDLLYLTFSDPWPKDRHEKRRLTNEIFLKIYDKILKKPNKIILKTDNRLFFEYSLISLSKYGYIIENISLDLHKEGMNIISTEYEEKFVADGNVIYMVECRK